MAVVPTPPDALGPDGRPVSYPNTPHRDPNDPAPTRRTGGGPVHAPTPPRRVTAQPRASAEEQGAKAMLATFLGQYGLASLGDWAWSRYQELGGGTDAMSVITLELTKRPEFAARFPAIAARDKAGLSPISPADYVHYEQGLNQMMHQYGLPFGQTSGQFSTYVTKLLAGDVSLAEAQSRIADGYMKVENAPQEVRDAFAGYFGVKGDAAMAALWLDPTEALPHLQQMQQAATLGGTARNFGIDMSKIDALDLAQHVTSGDGSQQFGQVDQLRALYHENLGEVQDLTQQTGVQAAFGLSGQAAYDLQRRAQQRAARTSGSGGAASAAGGLIGAGSAPPA